MSVCLSVCLSVCVQVGYVAQQVAKRRSKRGYDPPTDPKFSKEREGGAGRGPFFGVGLVQASKEGREEWREEYSLVLGWYK